MYEFIKTMLTELPSDMNGSLKAPVALHLFNISKEATKLPKTSAQLFHHLVPTLISLSRHKREDIQTAVVFLCTRFQTPSEDDYKKLSRLMQYIRCIREVTIQIKPGEHAS